MTTLQETSIERPIIFSAPMVRAILDGRKDITRRVVKPQPKPGPFPDGVGNEKSLWWDRRDKKPRGWWFGSSEKSFLGLMEAHAPYPVGTILWVKEAIEITYVGHTGAGHQDCCTVKYLASPEQPAQWFYDCDLPGVCFWDLKAGKRSPIFMPRWASRLTLEVVSVRVERLQDISDDDVIREGVCAMTPNKATYKGQFIIQPHRWPEENFRCLWNSLNEKRGFPWDSNPFVWRYEFKVIK